jgi:hypothetical protein
MTRGTAVLFTVTHKLAYQPCVRLSTIPRVLWIMFRMALWLFVMVVGDLTRSRSWWAMLAPHCLWDLNTELAFMGIEGVA